MRNGYMGQRVAILEQRTFVFDSDEHLWTQMDSTSFY